MLTFLKRQNEWALLAILLGITTLLGRAFNSIELSAIIPGSTPVNVYVAWLMILSGLVLYLPEKQWARNVRNLSGWLILIVSATLLGLVLFENAGAELAMGSTSNPTVAMGIGTRQPGRPAPNTCIAFISIGMSFLLLGVAGRTWTSFLIRSAQVLAVIMVVTGMTAYYVDFNEIYSWYTFNKMSVPAAIGIVAIMSGIWRRYKVLRPPFVRAAADEGARIVLFGALLLSGMGFAAGLTGFGVFMNYQETATGNQLLSSAVSLTHLYESLIEDGMAQTSYVAKNPALIDSLKISSGEESKHLMSPVFKNLLNDFNHAGFSSLVLYSSQNKEIASTGNAVHSASIAVPVRHDVNTSVIFDNDFYLQVRQNIVDGKGTLLGTIVSERALTKLRDSYFSVSKLGKTADSTVCGKRDDGMIQCFPSVLTRKANVLSNPDDGRPRRPIDDALDGKTGVQKAVDYRKKSVLAAYAPIGNTGMGVILKVDSNEIYLPIRSLLEKVLMILLVLLIIGIGVLKKIMVPVVDRIVSSQEREQERAVQTQAIVDHVYDGIVSMNAAGEIATFNKACENILGYQAAEVIGMHFSDLMSPRFRDAARRFFDGYKQADYDPALKTQRHRLSAIHKDGHEVFVEMGTNEVHLNNEITYVGIIHDITESRVAQIALESSETRLRTITENVPAGIAYFDRNETVLFANKIYASWLGQDIDGVLNKKLLALLDAEDYIQSRPHIETVLTGKEVAYEYVAQSDLPHRPHAMHITYIPDHGNNGVVKGFFAMITDITERKNREEMLTHLANHDTLTGLPNRRLFNDRLTQAMIRSHRHQSTLALFTLDVDHFKKINDTMGHDIGDELLKALGRRLQGVVRDSDTVARMGGDEFTILLDKILSLEALEKFADKLLAAIREPMTLGTVTISPSSSIGIAVYCAENITADTLLKMSDIALYKAKENGRNGYHIDQSIWPAKARVLRLIPDVSKPGNTA